jgi:coenzyme F420-0:L-glutamate ligase / coenzyme F420-1:gamma-L-glutamate ligase
LARPRAVALIPVRFPEVKHAQSLFDAVSDALQVQNLRLKNGDVLCVASKIVSLCENRTVRLEDVRVSRRVSRFARKCEMNDSLASIVIDESDLVLGGVKGFLLTVKNGILTANAGVDLKNSPPGTATLWPKNPDKSARRLRRRLLRRRMTRLGVEIVDSRVTPLRLGTIGLAIGLSGFDPVLDERTKPDLYGRKVKVTQSNIADDIAAAAHVLMGETTEKVAAVVVRNARVQFDGAMNSRRAKLMPQRCLIFGGMGRGPSR